MAKKTTSVPDRKHAVHALQEKWRQKNKPKQPLPPPDKIPGKP